MSEKNQTLQNFQILLASLYVVGQTLAGYYFKAICYFNLYLALITPCFDLTEKKLTQHNLRMLLRTFP